MNYIVKITDPLDKGYAGFQGHTSKREANANAEAAEAAGMVAEIRRASPGRQANGWAVLQADSEDWDRASNVVRGTRSKVKCDL